jgi:hypothetical protein
LSDTETAVGILDNLDETIDLHKGKMGPVNGWAAMRNPYDTDAQDFQAQVMTAAQVIGKSLEGGKMTDQDIQRYAKILPQITDTPAVAKRKLRSIKGLLKNVQSNQMEFYRNAQPDSLPSNPADVQLEG